MSAEVAWSPSEPVKPTLADAVALTLARSPMTRVPLSASEAVDPVTDAWTTLLAGATKKVGCWPFGPRSTPNEIVTVADPVAVRSPKSPPPEPAPSRYENPVWPRTWIGSVGARDWVQVTSSRLLLASGVPVNGTGIENPADWSCAATELQAVAAWLSEVWNGRRKSVASPRAWSSVWPASGSESTPRTWSTIAAESVAVPTAATPWSYARVTLARLND